MPATNANRAPDGIDPLVGFRAWRVILQGDEAHFFSLNGAMGWEGVDSGWVVATCLIAPWIPHPHLSLVTDAPAMPELPCDLCDSGHIAPDERCSCGIYAFKDLAPELVPILEGESDPAPGQEMRFVVGRVELAGKVIEHELGYRAGRARIAALIPVDGRDTFTRQVSKVTGIPLDPCIRLPRRRERTPTPRWEPDEGFPYGWVWATCFLSSWTIALAGGPRVPGILLFGTVVLGQLLTPRLRDRIRAFLRRRGRRPVRLTVVR